MIRKLLDFLRSLFRNGESKADNTSGTDDHHADSCGEVVTIMQIKEGDTRPSATTEIDTNLPLDSATVRFRMADDSGTVVIDQPATVVDAPNGELSYTFSSTETAERGDYGVEWVVEYDGERQTFPTVGKEEIQIEAALNRS